MSILTYAAVIYLAIGCWPAVLTWFAFPEMNPVLKFLLLVIFTALWPLALIADRKRS